MPCYDVVCSVNAQTEMQRFEQNVAARHPTVSHNAVRLRTVSERGLMRVNAHLAVSFQRQQQEYMLYMREHVR